MGGRLFQPGAAHPNWKGDAAPLDTKRRRAQNRYPEIGLCRRCGRPATERHHRDRDLNNAEPDNIEPLCVQCHKQEHRPDPARPAAVCKVCGRSVKEPWGGRCSACAEYYKVRGVERPPALYGRVLLKDQREGTEPLADQELLRLRVLAHGGLCANGHALTTRNARLDPKSKELRCRLCGREAQRRAVARRKATSNGNITQ
jgi:ribosomal protein S27E